MARRGFSGRGMISVGGPKKKAKKKKGLGKEKYLKAKGTGEPLRAARMLAGY